MSNFSIPTFALFSAHFLPVSAAMAVTITEIPEMVRSHNHDVKITEMEVDVAEREINIAKARYLPNIDLKSSYTRLDKDVVLDIPNHHIEKQILNGSVSIGVLESSVPAWPFL